MIKPSNVCVILIFLDMIIGMLMYVGLETKSIPAPIGLVGAVIIVAFLVGIWYVREFAKRAEVKLGWR